MIFIVGKEGLTQIGIRQQTIPERDYLYILQAKIRGLGVWFRSRQGRQERSCGIPVLHRKNEEDASFVSTEVACAHQQASPHIEPVPDQIVETCDLEFFPLLIGLSQVPEGLCEGPIFSRVIQEDGSKLVVDAFP